MSVIIALIIVAGLIMMLAKSKKAEELAREEQRAKWRKYGAAKRARRKANSGR